MKRVFLVMVVSAMLVTLGFTQTPAAGSNTDPASVQGCLGGSDGAYTVVQDGTGQLFKISSSSVDLKAHLGHDVKLTGQKSSAAAGNSLAVTELAMISEHCAAAAAAPAATVTPSPETVIPPDAATVPPAAASAAAAAAPPVPAGPAAAVASTPPADSAAPGATVTPTPSTPAVENATTVDSQSGCSQRTRGRSYATGCTGCPACRNCKRTRCGSRSHPATLSSCSQSRSRPDRSRQN